MTGTSPRLEQLIVELAATGSVVYVFGLGWLTVHLGGAATPVFNGSGADRCWHVEVGDHGRWVLSVKLAKITNVGFVRALSPFPRFPGQESLTVHFVGPDGTSTLKCYLADLYEDGRMVSEKLAAWDALRARFGDIQLPPTEAR